MEVFTSVWVILLLYCTEWLGVRQCLAVPLPTLANYHHNYYSKNSWHYRKARYPEISNEKFVFPGKQGREESLPRLAERSGFGVGNAGKIYFPDEVPEVTQDKDKSYQFANSEVRPVWKTQHRPSSADSDSQTRLSSMDSMKSLHHSQDGTIRVEPSTAQMQQLQKSQPYMDFSGTDLVFKSPLHSPSSNKKSTQEQHVQEAVQEFYKWLQVPGNRSKNQNKLVTTTCSEQSEAGSGSTAGTSGNRQGLHNSQTTSISDQSLVGGLKNQKCPEGQIRLENGECRVKVEI